MLLVELPVVSILFNQLRCSADSQQVLGIVLLGRDGEVERAREQGAIVNDDDLVMGNMVNHVEPYQAASFIAQAALARHAARRVIVQ